ncbi:MAG TPA: RNA 2',3'-cyclic phosphodiesterase [Vicinamibacterales bacterium]|nr:RNA 2',3'-cyclic phosphodiesterase [Vicinamibacterales bacterium]
MRLFIGIELSDAVRRNAAATAERLRHGIARNVPRAVLRWIPSENLHITVWFFGDVPDAGVVPLVDTLRAGLSVRPFTLRLAGIGIFPPSGVPRAIWLGLVAGRDPLLAVYDALRHRLQPLGFAPERRPFAPHLTIARVKNVHRSDVSAVHRVLRQADAGDVGACEITHATLFKSRTLPDGSRYEALLRVPLI